MERTTPVRKPHTSTADLLTWPENPVLDSPLSAQRSNARSHQPSDGISKVVFGGLVTDEEVENLLKRKPCSGHKMKEMTGSGIFIPGEENPTSDEGSFNAPNNKTGLRMYQQVTNGMSQISFGTEETVSLKKPTTVPEVAKQRELSGTLDTDADPAFGLKKQSSDAKFKELSGNDIFAPPPEILPRSNPSENCEPKSPLPGEDPVLKTAKKIYEQKIMELTGNDIFKGEAVPGSAENKLSVAKMREMSGNDIFADGKVEDSRRDYFGGVRKPPGGESSIALV